jgi:hypothetical protein
MIPQKATASIVLDRSLIIPCRTAAFFILLLQSVHRAFMVSPSAPVIITVWVHGRPVRRPVSIPIASLLPGRPAKAAFQLACPFILDKGMPYAAGI